MKCPFGLDDHPVTWRCYTTYACDWVVGVIPETWPLWTFTPIFWLMTRLDLTRPEGDILKERTP